MRSAASGLLVVLVLCGACGRQQGGAPPAPDAPAAPDWAIQNSNSDIKKPSPPGDLLKTGGHDPAAMRLRDFPASKDPPAYQLPLEYTLETPEVPGEIAGPTPTAPPSQEGKEKH
jgi:hypothetical protein